MNVITVTPPLTIRHHIGLMGKDGTIMRAIILVVAMFFPLTSGIVSVMMADPAVNEPGAVLAHHPEIPNIAARLDPRPR